MKELSLVTPWFGIASSLACCSDEPTVLFQVQLLRLDIYKNVFIFWLPLFLLC